MLRNDEIDKHSLKLKRYHHGQQNALSDPVSVFSLPQTDDFLPSARQY